MMPGRGVMAVTGPGRGERRCDRVGDARAYRLEWLAIRLTNTTGVPHERTSTDGWVNRVDYAGYVITCDPNEPLDASGIWTFTVRRPGDSRLSAEIDADTWDGDGAVPGGNIPVAADMIAGFAARSGAGSDGRNGQNQPRP